MHRVGARGAHRIAVGEVGYTSAAPGRCSMPKRRARAPPPAGALGGSQDGPGCGSVGRDGCVGVAATKCAGPGGAPSHAPSYTARVPRKAAKANSGGVGRAHAEAPDAPREHAASSTSRAVRLATRRSLHRWSIGPSGISTVGSSSAVSAGLRGGNPSRSRAIGPAVTRPYAPTNPRGLMIGAPPPSRPPEQSNNGNVARRHTSGRRLSLAEAGLGSTRPSPSTCHVG